MIKLIQRLVNKYELTVVVNAKIEDDARVATVEKVKETKLEVICNVENVKEVLEIIKKNHPYETPGIDIIPLMDESYFN